MLIVPKLVQQTYALHVTWDIALRTVKKNTGEFIKLLASH